jgi:hypothetical protein
VAGTNEPPIERHYSAPVIAAKLGVSADLIRAEMDRCNLPYVMLGRLRVVPESALVKYVAGLKIERASRQLRAS